MWHKIKTLPNPNGGDDNKESTVGSVGSAAYLSIADEKGGAL
jgi:hypothetical protein